MYAYKVSLGEFNDFNFGAEHIWLGWIYWVLSSLFLLIILLNLLIAIISEKFSEVFSNMEAATYNERAQLLIDSNVILKCIKRNKGSGVKGNGCLLVVKEQSDE